MGTTRCGEFAEPQGYDYAIGHWQRQDACFRAIRLSIPAVVDPPDLCRACAFQAHSIPTLCCGPHSPAWTSPRTCFPRQFPTFSSNLLHSTLGWCNMFIRNEIHIADGDTFTIVHISRAEQFASQLHSELPAHRSITRVNRQVTQRRLSHHSFSVSPVVPTFECVCVCTCMCTVLSLCTKRLPSCQREPCP